MYRRFRDRRRTMSQLNILQQQVQYREADHQNCADDENGPNTSKERCTDLRIEGFEQVWTVVISAESFFQFRTHLRQQYRIREGHHRLLRHAFGDGTGEIVMIIRQQKTAENRNAHGASNGPEKSRGRCSRAHVLRWGSTWARLQRP